MKKITVISLVFLAMVLLSSSISAALLSEEAIDAIKSEGFLANVDDGYLTYAEFKELVAAAFPGKENLISGDGFVTRSDFIVSLVEVLGLQGEAAKFDEVRTMAFDEDQVPEPAIGAFSLAFQSNRQLMTYRYGHILQPEEPITREEAAHAVYMALNPPQQGGRAVTAVTADAPGFNTLFTSAGLVWTLNNIIGDGYIGTNQDGYYHPRMIRRMPTLENGLMQINSDGTMSITYELRSGMKWHDGEPVTANDAKFQWEVMTSGAPVTSSYYEHNVNEVEIHDDLTFTIHLDDVVGNAEFGSSGYAYYFGWFQLPEHKFKDAFEEDKNSGNWDSFVDFVNQNPIMTGPYKFKEYREGERIVIEAFEDYFMGRPNIDEIVIRIVPDSDVVFASTLAGEIDFGRYTLTLQQSLQLERERPELFETYYTPNVAVDMVFLNFNDPDNLAEPHPIFGDPRVRQAILMALDRDRLNQIVYFELADPAHTWITPLHSMREALDGATEYSYDPNGAQELLAEAGWEMNPQGFLEKDGRVFEFTLAGMAGSREQEIASQLIQAMLRQVGISVKVDLKPAQVVWANVMPYREFDALLSGWGYGISCEALNYWHTSSIPSEANSWGGTNYAGWANQENDEIIEKAARELDPEKKAELYREHFALWTHYLPVLPLYSAPTPHFAKADIKSFNSGYDNGLGWIIYNWYFQQ